MTRITIDTQDFRDIKALQLAAGAEQWESLPNGGFSIRSSDGLERYRVSEFACTCPDHRRGQRCKHIRAVALHNALREVIHHKSRVIPSNVSILTEPDDSCWRFEDRAEESSFKQPRFTCRASGSGSQTCSTTTDTPEGMRAHYASVHNWTADLDTVRATEMRYRELAGQP